MISKLKEILDFLAVPLYIVKGRIPWSAGYYTVKKRAIVAATNQAAIQTGAALPHRYGCYIDERVIECPWAISQLPKHPGQTLDAGSALNHSFLLDMLPLDRMQLTVMTLAPEKRCFWKKHISYVFGDLRRTNFANDAFDTIVSVSTIEHIGLDNTLLYTSEIAKKESDALGFESAIREFKRILRPGGVCLITVPFGQRGVYGWYQIFDLEMVQKIIDIFAPTEHSIEYFGYFTDGWRRVDSQKIKDAAFYDVHAKKQPDADRAAGARGVACLKLYK